MISRENDFEDTYLQKAQRLQDGLVAHSTDGSFDGGDIVYKRLRQELIDNKNTKKFLPEFIVRYRDLSQFWQFIKIKFKTYKERRVFLYDSFHPILTFLESNDKTPNVELVNDTLYSFNVDTVHVIWQKALERRVMDPEGAITAARSLLESTCKHILDEDGVIYPDDCDLPKLWALCAEQLNLAPAQHQEQVFKSILGNCQSIVNNVAAIRNRIGDAHGYGKKAVKPSSRHAELVVNLSGTMASFLVATWKAKNSN